MTKPASHPATFLTTKEYRRFVEFCDDCRTQRVIGVCYGAPGVGKTLSAWEYANWQAFHARSPYYMGWMGPTEQITNCRSILYTPTVAHHPRQINRDITKLRDRLNFLVADATKVATRSHDVHRNYTELIIVDEADRLNVAGIEQLRDLYDQDIHGLGLILIGQPGIEKKLSRYAQLYSRVGFAHLFRTLSEEETRTILCEQVNQIEPGLAPEQLTDPAAVAAILQTVNGNLRLLQKLLAQIKRTLALNNLTQVTKEIVQFAREGLVIGEA